MAMASFTRSVRLEDIFQDEVLATFTNITEFKKFARSRHGLCLNEADIQNALDDNSSSTDQKLDMLFKWRVKNGKEATVSRIRYLVERYQEGDNPKNYTSLHEMFGLFRDKKLCKRGHVYVGEQISTLLGSIPRAIKMLPYDDKNFREAEILTTLGPHENVISVVHADKFNGGFANYVYIVMELFSSKTLREVLEEIKKLKTVLDADTVLSMATQLVKALVFIHEKKVIHRDLKPENILVSDDNKKLKVTDFGISKFIRDELYTRQTSADIGTEGYSSPETYNDNVISQKSDVFSAGIILAELFSRGHHPFGDNPDLWKHHIKTYQNLDISRMVVCRSQAEYLIGLMLLLDPEERPTALDVLNQLKVFGQTKTPEVQKVVPVVQLSEKFKGLAVKKKAQTPSSTKVQLLKESQATAAQKLNPASSTTKETDKEVQLPEGTKDSDVQKDGTSSTKKIQSSLQPPVKSQGFSASTTTSLTHVANAIILFNINDCHMYSFKPATKELKKMQAFDGVYFDGSTVLLGQHLYMIQNEIVARLKYTDLTPECNTHIKEAHMNEDHGEFPRVVVFKGSIYACGCGSSNEASRSVSQFEELKNEWLSAPDMNIARYRPCVVATEDHIYCIGGFDERGSELRSVERFDGSRWEFVKRVPRELTDHASAAVLDEEIYVSDEEGVQCYNIQTDSWREANLSSKWPFENLTKIFNVNNELYIVGGTEDYNKLMYMLNPRTDEMTFIHDFDDKITLSFPGFYVDDCHAAYI